MMTGSCGCHGQIFVFLFDEYERLNPQARSNVRVSCLQYQSCCQIKAAGVWKSLIPEFFLLRPDTADLAMRFGLHSGSVTAGVLRGEKSRFQLFGDSVNTGKSNRYWFHFS